MSIADRDYMAKHDPPSDAVRPCSAKVRRKINWWFWIPVGLLVVALILKTTPFVFGPGSSAKTIQEFCTMTTSENMSLLSRWADKCEKLEQTLTKQYERDPHFKTESLFMMCNALYQGAMASELRPWLIWPHRLEFVRVQKDISQWCGVDRRVKSILVKVEYEKEILSPRPEGGRSYKALNFTFLLDAKTDLILECEKGEPEFWPE
jgi:hypothetical protein